MDELLVIGSQKIKLEAMGITISCYRNEATITKIECPDYINNFLSVRYHKFVSFDQEGMKKQKQVKIDLKGKHIL